MAKPTKLKEMIAEPDTFAARFCECARDTWGDDASLREIAAALGVTAPTVGDWLRREAARGDLRAVIVMLERHDGTYSTEHAIAAPPLRLVTSAQ